MKEALANAIRSMISIEENEIERFLNLCEIRSYKAKDYLSRQGVTSHEIFFVVKGLTRSTILDQKGEEHTIHFSLEGQFIAEYTSFMLQQPATNNIQAIEETEVVVLPRTAIEWGYNNMKEGDKLGRKIAEGYFIYFDNRLKNQYIHTPSQRYEMINKIFPSIHHRVPQHMIASYLGISPVHLSRLKKESK